MRLKFLAHFLIVLVLIFVMNAMRAGQAWSMKYKGDRYYILNHTSDWLICTAKGDYYYFNEFEVPPNKASRTYRLPDESFVVTCD